MKLANIITLGVSTAATLAAASAVPATSPNQVTPAAAPAAAGLNQTDEPQQDRRDAFQPDLAMLRHAINLVNEAGVYMTIAQLLIAEAQEAANVAARDDHLNYLMEPPQLELNQAQAAAQNVNRYIQVTWNV